MRSEANPGHGGIVASSSVVAGLGLGRSKHAALRCNDMMKKNRVTTADASLVSPRITPGLHRMEGGARVADEQGTATAGLPHWTVCSDGTGIISARGRAILDRAAAAARMGRGHGCVCSLACGLVRYMELFIWLRWACEEGEDGEERDGLPKRGVA